MSSNLYNMHPKDFLADIDRQVKAFLEEKRGPEFLNDCIGWTIMRDGDGNVKFQTVRLVDGVAGDVVLDETN
jgi:hypothetical protein